MSKLAIIEPKISQIENVKTIFCLIHSRHNKFYYSFITFYAFKVNRIIPKKSLLYSLITSFCESAFHRSAVSLSRHKLFAENKIQPTHCNSRIPTILKVLTTKFLE